MKYLVLGASLLAASAQLSAVSAASGFDCARFQSAQDIRMTKGAQKACHRRYVQLLGLEERNRPPKEEPQKEEPQKEEPSVD